MMNGAFEFFTQRAGVLAGDARDEDALFPLQQFGGYPDNLGRGFSRAKNHFRKPLAERAVGVHPGEAQVRHRRGLERAQHPVAAHAAGAEFFQKLDGFRRCHECMMTGKADAVTKEKSAANPVQRIQPRFRRER